MTFIEFIEKLQDIIDTIVPFIIGLAVFIIIWGIFKYVTHAAEEEKRAEARAFIIYGIIGVFFMLSIWGFVNILYNTFDLDNKINDKDIIPQVPRIVGPDCSDIETGAGSGEADCY